MLQRLVDTLQSVPPEIATILLAGIPVGELRGALPVALLAYDMPVVKAVILSIFGNMIPVYFLLAFFEKGSAWFRARSEKFDKAMIWLFDRTRRKLEEKVDKYGYWALALFVAIPLPVTGAWTGSLAAFVFGLPRKKSFFSILLGVFVSSMIVTLLTLGSAVAAARLLG